MTGASAIGIRDVQALGSRAASCLLIFAESMAIALAAGVMGILVTFPVAAAFADRMGTLFPVFLVSPATLAMQLGAALVIGLVAAALPAWRAARQRIVDGLRAVG